ncbi:DUF6233 domain-containing protein [Streptomyces siamensis]|uniref:DUF6233 domain-containing protein n=1 Tax=Streptomyces siamensis TaxID=1274986 RepID=UPI003CD0B645
MDTPPRSTSHVDGCQVAGKRPRGAARDQALSVLVDGIPARSHCRPRWELGHVE